MQTVNDALSGNGIWGLAFSVLVFALPLAWKEFRGSGAWLKMSARQQVIARIAAMVVQSVYLKHVKPAKIMAEQTGKPVTERTKKDWLQSGILGLAEQMRQSGITPPSRDELAALVQEAVRIAKSADAGPAYQDTQGLAEQYVPTETRPLPPL